MANHELRSMDIIIDSRDIDATEKKLRGLDRMLVQTQRRALALGSTRIRPSITLEDRFTETAIRLSATMKRLNQAAARPVAELIDLATPKIAEIRGALQELSRTRWRVEVDVGGFGAALGSSVAEQICAEGQSLMQRISVTLKEALECIFDALEVVECPAVAVGECKCGEPSGSSPQESEPLCGAAGKISGEAFFEAFLEVINPQRIAGKLANLPWDEILSSSMAYLKKFGSDILDSLVKDIRDKLIEIGATKLKSYWDNSKLKKEWIPKAWESSKGKLDEWAPKARNFLDKTTSKATDFLSKPWVKKTTKFVGKWGGKLLKKVPIVSSLFSIVEIINAKPGRERVEKIGGFLGGLAGGTIGAALGGGILSIPAGLAGGVLGEYAGEWVGGALFDLFYGKKKQPETDSGYPLGTSKADVFLQGHSDTYSTKDKENWKRELIYGSQSTQSIAPLTEEEINSVAEYFKEKQEPAAVPAPMPLPNYAPGPAPVPFPAITFNMPPGLIQIHERQEDIDIDSLTDQVGWSVAQNLNRMMKNMKRYGVVQGGN
ncbi:hypothetical protein [Paenibacillus fonticola]|uniref:hypothetical protein n=1 Tax=Paenibacillus fonticola TaxID=379896 RepID=UPI00035E5938|nr:hypothetical protein [Paenibacillus fonticola]